MDRPNWDTFFTTLAFVAAQRSSDRETKVGSALAGKDHKVLSLGYNGFPRGCKDENIPTTRPDKYFYMIHAERNCLKNATEIPDPQNSTMYVTTEPCSECIKEIIQDGIGKIVYAGVGAASLQSKSQEYQAKMDKMLDGVPLSITPFSGTKEDVLKLLKDTYDYVNERWV
jgi:dCMP deaminase